MGEWTVAIIFQAVGTKQVKAGVSIPDIAIAGQNLFWA